MIIIACLYKKCNVKIQKNKIFIFPHIIYTFLNVFKSHCRKDQAKKQSKNIPLLVKVEQVYARHQLNAAPTCFHFEATQIIDIEAFLMVSSGLKGIKKSRI